MAQIIKHRRGSLESVSSATKRAGELLVVTGSAGITATNGNSILFVGIDGSTATPANKILQGSTNPNLTGASYDTSIDGIPFYNTADEKLYILNKGGNVEVKATANTGGSGIVSGSAQVKDLLPAGTVSGSSQVELASTTGFSDYSSSVDSRVASNTTDISSSLDKINELYATASNHESRVDELESFSSSLDSTFATDSELANVSASLKNDTVELFSTASDHETRIDSIESAIGAGSNIDGRLVSLEAFTGSQETKNNTLGNYTASVDSSLSALNTFSASEETKNNTLGNYTASVDVSLSALNTFSASEETKNNTLGVYTASVDVSLSALNAFTESQDNLNNTFATTGSNVFNGTQVITGSLFITNDLVVFGSSSLFDVTASRLDIGDNTILLNTATPAIRFAGIDVIDSGSTGETGSFYWDSLKNNWLYVQPESANEGYNSALFIAGPKNTGSLGDEAGLTSGFIPVAIGENHIDNSIMAQSDGNLITVTGGLNVTGTISGSIEGIGNVALYSASVDGRLDSIESSIGDGGSIGNRVSALEAFTSSEETKNNTLGNYTASVDVSLSALNTFSASEETKNNTLGVYTASVDSSLSNLISTASNHETRVNALESFSSSLDAGFVSEAELAILSGSLDSRIVNLESFSSSIDTTIKTKLDVEGVISGSSQVDYVSISNIPAGIVSGSTQLDGTTINNLTTTATGSFTGSFVGDGSQLTGLVTDLRISGSTGNDTVSLLTDSLLITGSTGITTVVSDNTITISGTDASTSAKGVASFDADDFSVTSGNVSIKENGVRAVNLNADVAGNGISLNGVNNSIEVDYGSSAGTAVEGNTSLIINGTANEIEILSGSITLGNGGTVTIGLPDSVTIATASILQDLTVGRDLTVDGNLFVNGTTTTIDSTTIQLGDNIIELNGSGGLNAGLLVRDVTSPNTASGSLLWNSTSDYWMGGALGEEKEFARYNSTPSSGSVQVVSENGLLVNSQISDDAIKVTIGTDLVINGLSASSFLVSNGSKKLISVVPTNAGDMVQWNGSSFIASNEIDGGSF
jgi:hypothetical protein